MNKVIPLRWTVRVSGRTQKAVRIAPLDVQVIFRALLIDLENTGPIQYEWRNYSKLTGERYHCHLNYRYVAVWKVVDRKIRVLEVLYVGHRKDAPY